MAIETVKEFRSAVGRSARTLDLTLAALVAQFETMRELAPTEAVEALRELVREAETELARLRGL